MKQTTIWQDINTSVDRALGERLDLLPEDGLVHRSDALLAQLPSVGGSQPISTTIFLRRYRTSLHHELCRGTQPRMVSGAIADDLCELSRAVMVTVGSAEGLSVEAAVGLALVLYKRGVIPFCALPAVPVTTA